MTVPSFSCKGRQSVALGDAAYDATSASWFGGAVVLACEKGKPSYLAGAWFPGDQGHPGAFNMPIEPGDVVQIQKTCNAFGVGPQIYMQDLSRNPTAEQVVWASSNTVNCLDMFVGDLGVLKHGYGAGPVPVPSFLPPIGTKSSGAVEQLPKFGSAAFSDVQFQNTNSTGTSISGIGLENLGPLEYSYYEGKANQIVTGPITGEASSAFVTTQT